MGRTGMAMMLLGKFPVHHHRIQALCEFSEKLTRASAAIRPEDWQRLRAQGLADRDILDAVEVIAYFNYINRVADALGIDAEPEMEDAWSKWQPPQQP